MASDYKKVMRMGEVAVQKAESFWDEFQKPAIELTEQNNQFEVKVAVAGVDPKDLKVDVTTEDLLVKGKTRPRRRRRRAKFIRANSSLRRRCRLTRECVSWFRVELIPG